MSGSLQLEQSPAFQRRSAQWQRAGWIAMGLFVVAGAVGLLGHGPLSRTTAHDEASALHVEYARLTRVGSLAAMLVQGPTRVSGSARIQLQISSDSLDRNLIRSIMPTPVAVFKTQDRYVFEFISIPSSSSTVVRFELQTLRPGPNTFDVSFGSNGGLRLRQWVLP